MQLIKMIYSAMLATLFATAIASADILIVHGKLLPETDSRRREPVYPITRAYIRYEILKIGRGKLDPNISNSYKDDNGNLVSSNAIPISFFQRTAIESLPPNAILILDNGFWEQFTPQHSYRVLGEDARRGILPYSPAAWQAILKKTNEELADTPSAKQLPPEEAMAQAEQHLAKIGVTANDAFYFYPRRFPFQVTVGGVYLQNEKLYDFCFIFNDRGDVLNEIGPKLDRYYKPGEELETYFIRNYPGRRPYRRYDIPTRPEPTPKTHSEDQPIL